MANPFLAEIRIFAGNFAPRGWALCDGQIIAIAPNTALFSLLGTNYGGNGTNNFGLPNLQGCAPMHWGQGAGLSTHVIGEIGGSSSVTLLSNQVPSHSHTYYASAGTKGGVDSATGNTNADEKSPNVAYATTKDGTVMNTGMIQATSSQAHENMQPYLVLNFIIALQGIYPARG